MICVEALPDGSLSVVDPQPADTSGCGMVLVSGLEAASSPWALTPEQGSDIGGAILAVWGLAFVFRLLARTLSTVDEGVKE